MDPPAVWVFLPGGDRWSKLSEQQRRPVSATERKEGFIVYPLKLEDYLWISSRTGGAGRDRRLVREIRGVPAVQRPAVLEQCNDDNWK